MRLPLWELGRLITATAASQARAAGRGATRLADAPPRGKEIPGGNAPLATCPPAAYVSLPTSHPHPPPGYTPSHVPAGEGNMIRLPQVQARVVRLCKLM